MQNSGGLEEIISLLDLCHRIRQTLVVRTQELTGLTLEQAVVLYRIGRNGGRVTISQLAGEISRTSHTVSAMINGLEKVGMVYRQRESQTDRRHVWVTMTSLGLERLSDFRDSADSLAHALLLNSLDEPTMERVRLAINELVELLGQ